MTLWITPGDPLGIGPEVAVKALRRRIDEGRPVDAVLIGDPGALHRWGSDGLQIEEPPPGDEPVEVRAIRLAVGRLLSGEGLGLVTGPIHKGRLMGRGFRHPGHTEFLGELCGVQRPVMAFVGGRLRVSLVTVHLPLARVSSALDQEGVVQTLRVSREALVGPMGVSRGRLAVCGVNPHAGDGGVLGTEELRIIGPACDQARSEGIDVVGPISAETAFRLAMAGGVDWVVAMYHDQGLVPLKVVDFGESVNWTLGLPILRTSVDHGTADDIAGKGVADPAGMLAAIGLAESLAGSSGQRSAVSGQL